MPRDNADSGKCWKFGKHRWWTTGIGGGRSWRGSLVIRHQRCECGAFRETRSEHANA